MKLVHSKVKPEKKAKTTKGEIEWTPRMIQIEMKERRKVMAMFKDRIDKIREYFPGWEPNW